MSSIELKSEAKLRINNLHRIVHINANHWTERRVKRIWKKMEKLGLRTERLGLEWISAAEGLRFQQVMERMEHIRKSVTSEEIAGTLRILKEKRKQ